mmetsp:Transcript_52617/g.139752  ORF Transcript_52617/g.139752 Transcript_52617/m.139752 type:complete len:1775 (-) Transcript_52617:582-5906(-)
MGKKNKGKEPLLQKLLEPPLRAAWILEDAVQGRYFEEKYYPQDLRARTHYLGAREQEKIYDRAVILLFCLAFFEVPLWCDTTDSFSFLSPHERCQVEAESGTKTIVYMSGLPHIPPGYSLIMELMVCLVLYCKLSAESKLQNTWFNQYDINYINKYFNMAGKVALWGTLFDIVLFSVGRHHWRVAPFLRVLLMLCMPKLNQLLCALVNMVGEWLSVASFWMGTVVFFAWISVTIFEDAQQKNGEGTKINEGFETFGDGLYTMFVASSTDDFVDKFNATFTYNRAYGLLWLVCLFLSNFLFLNLILAMVFETYSKKFSKTMKGVFANREKSISQVYQILDDWSPDEPGITKSTFQALTAAYSESPMAPKLDSKDVQYIFLHLDKEDRGTLDEENFKEVARALQYTFWISDKRNSLEQRHPEWYTKDRLLGKLSALVWDSDDGGATSKLDNFMNIVLLLNAVVVVMESAQDLAHETNYDGVFTMIEFLFGWAYVVEFVIILSAMSWEEYMSSKARWFDFFTTWLLFAVSCAYYLPFADVQGELMKYANMLRLLRLIRVVKSLKRLPKVAFMFNCVCTLLASARDILLFLLVIVYAYSAIGCMLFGGCLYLGNEKLEGSEYEETKLFALNFNDMISACSLWFVNLLCEYNAPIADGVHQSLPAYKQSAWLVFPMFYFTVVILAFELVAAFTIETFVALTSDQPESDDEEELADDDEVEEPKLEGLEKLAAELLEEDPPLCFHYTKSASAEQEEVYEMMFKNEEEEENEGDEGEDPWALEENADEEAKERWVLAKELWEAREQLGKIKSGQDMEGSESDEGDDMEYEEKDTKMSKYERAAWMLEDAISGRGFEWYPESMAARKVYLSYRAREVAYYKSIAVMFILGYFEVPLWCDTSASFAFKGGQERCQVGGPESIAYLSGLPQIPPGFTMLIELICLITVYLKLRSERKLQKKFFDKKKVNYINGTFFAVCYIAMLTSVWDVWIFGTFRPSARLAPYMRVVFMVCIPAVNRLLKALVGIINEWLSVVSFWMGTVGFFAWIGVTLLNDNEEVNTAGMKVNEGFDSFGSSVYTMFVASSSDDFVDKFNPTFTQNRAYGLLWIVCLFLSNFLFLNLILAMIFEKYAESFKNEMKKFQKNQTGSLHKAFRLVSTSVEGERVVKEQDFFELIRALNESASMQTLDEGHMKYVFRALDDDEGGSLEKEEFECVIDAIQFTFWITPKYSSLERKMPGVYKSQTMKVLKEWVWDKDPYDENATSKLDIIMNVILLLNTVVVVAESYYDMQHISTYTNMFTFVETIFGLLYVVEFMILMMCMSWAEYTSSTSRIFDCFTTWLLFCVSMLYYVPFANLERGLMHYANILRLLRLIRVLKSAQRVPKVAFMFNCVSTILSSATDILTLLIIILYFYSSIGVQHFGGVLYQGNELLEGTEYGEKEYFVLNFNDLLSANVLFFVNLLCEFDAALADGLHAALPPWRHGGNPSWLIFPIFYFSVVIFAFELVCAFIIETFSELAAKEREKQEKLEEKEKEDARRELEDRVNKKPLGETGSHDSHEEETHSEGGHSGSGSESSESSEGGELSKTKEALNKIAEGLEKEGQMFHYTVSAQATKQEIYKMMFEGEGESDDEDDEEAAEILKLRRMTTERLNAELEKTRAKIATTLQKQISGATPELQDQFKRVMAEGNEVAIEARAEKKRAADLEKEASEAKRAANAAERTARAREADLVKEREEGMRLRQQIRQLQGVPAVPPTVVPTEPIRININEEDPLTFQVSGSISLR